MPASMDMLMLVCATVAALGFGVVAAQMICRAGFAILRVHAQSVALRRQEANGSKLETKTAAA